MNKLVFSLFMTFMTGIFGQQFNGINTEILKNFDRKEVNNASFSYYAENLNSGNVLIDVNSMISLSPASCLKLVTSAAALEYLKEEFCFNTILGYQGSINSKGELEGNIVIKASGDPTFGSNRIKGNPDLDSIIQKFIYEIRKSGINKIRGKILIDESIFDNNYTPDGWNWIDLGNYYAPPITPLAINENMYVIRFKGDSLINYPAKIVSIKPFIDGLAFTNMVKTDEINSGDNAYIYNPHGSLKPVIRGTIPCCLDFFEIKGSIPNPSDQFQTMLSKEIKKSGIKIDNLKFTKTKYEKVLYVHKSPQLKEIILYLNKRSINIYAEMLLKQIGYSKFNNGSFINGIKAINEFLEQNGVDTGMNIVDGSGLSRSNLVTTKSLVKLLRYVYKSKFYTTFIKSLGIAGESNDISYFQSYGLNSPLATNGFIKDGLIDGVRSHSGFIRNIRGEMIAFSFIVNNYLCSTKFIDNFHIKLMQELCL